MSVFTQWTCIFPGPMGLSWKSAWDKVGTHQQARIQATKNCNVVAVPVELFNHIKEVEQRMVKAESLLNQIRVDSSNWYTEKERSE